MHLIYVRKLPINWRNRHVYANEIARHVASRRVTSCQVVPARSHGNATATAAEVARRARPNRKRESNSTSTTSSRLSAPRTRTMYKNNGGGLDARGTEFESATGVVQRSNRNVEVFHAPGRRRNSRQSSSRKEGRVGAEDAFAIHAVLL